MENFEAKYIFPHDYKNNMKIVYLNLYQNYNATICLSFCFLWIGIILIITTDYIGYGLLLIAISLISFFSGFRNILKKTNEFIKKHTNHSNSNTEKAIMFDNKIHIKDSLNNVIKEYRYTDIEYLIENEKLFVIRLKSGSYMPIYKDNFTIGKPSELKKFLYKKNPFEKYIYTKLLISNSTIWTAIAVMISTILILLLNAY